MSIPQKPKIGDRWTDANGVEMEYVKNNSWMRIDGLSYVQEKRSQNYPKLEEQLDMLYHEIKENGSISSNGYWFQTIDNIKESFPKP